MRSVTPFLSRSNSTARLMYRHTLSVFTSHWASISRSMVATVAPILIGPTPWPAWMASTGPSGTCTVLAGTGATAALAATGASAAARALDIAEGEVFGDSSAFVAVLQPQTEVAKMKLRVNQAVHERMKPPGPEPLARPKHAPLSRATVGI